MAKAKMAESKTRFEQVPLAVVKEVAEEDVVFPRLHRVVCAICGKPIDLIHCKTDERGNAVHDTCYLMKMSRARIR